jgi:hypothetical protein
LKALLLVALGYCVLKVFIAVLDRYRPFYWGAWYDEVPWGLHW